MESQYVDVDDAAAAPSPADKPDSVEPDTQAGPGKSDLRGSGADHHTARSPLRALLMR